MSSITRICPSQAGEPPIPIVGTATAAVSSREALGNPLNDQRECPGLGDRDAVAHDLVAFARCVPTRAVPAQRIDRLRGQPNMPHDGHTARAQ